MTSFRTGNPTSTGRSKESLKLRKTICCFNGLRPHKDLQHKEHFPCDAPEVERVEEDVDELPAEPAPEHDVRLERVLRDHHQPELSLDFCQRKFKCCLKSQALSTHGVENIKGTDESWHC